MPAADRHSDLDRLACLEAMGLTLYSSRRDLPGAAPSRRVLSPTAVAAASLPAASRDAAPRAEPEASPGAVPSSAPSPGAMPGSLARLLDAPEARPAPRPDAPAPAAAAKADTLRFRLADQFGRCRPGRGQFGRAVLEVVAIGRQQVHHAIAQEALRGALGARVEAADEGAAGELQPGAHAGRLDEVLVVLLDVTQPLRVGDDRYVAGGEHAVDEVQHARRGGVMGRLKEEVAAAVQRGQAAGVQALEQLGGDLDIGADGHFQRDGCVRQRLPEGRERGLDPLHGVVEEAGVNVRRARPSIPGSMWQ